MQINNLKKMCSGVMAAFLLFLILQNSAFAQDTIPTQIPDLDEQVDITLTPKLPEPGDAVTVTLDAYGIDLDNSTITWTSNGKIVLQGKGEKVLKTVAGKQGQAAHIIATINPPNSKAITETVTINPQSVDILWEAKTYTPPFYKGKAMLSSQESAKFVAMPNLVDGSGTPINSANLIYKWTQDGEVLGDRSGSGRNTLSYTDTILSQPVQIVVEASNGGDSVAQNFISIAPTPTEAYVYEKNPLYGTLFNKELSTLFDLGQNPEGTMSVYPFFYGINNRSSDNVSYTWTINNNPIDVPESQNDMTFRNTEDVDGKSSVGVNITNNNNTIEGNSISTIINFQKATSGFSF